MSIAILLFKSIFWDTLTNVLYFPVWWYTIGAKKRFLGLINGVSSLFRNLALKLMFTHLFKPMFGERSISGRIISFFMRLIILIWRSFLFLLGTISFFVLFALWMILPIISLWQIIKLLF
ncbi:hypothetical protein KKG58_00605 [Patescibacteria group bacterium]|nr:hypothetical protein [Patescibacteria group bacterium]